MLDWLFPPKAPPAPETPAYPVRRRVIVNPKSGDVLRGVLWDATSEFLVLKGAELLRPRAEPSPIDGDVVIYRANVLFIQVLPQPTE